MTKSKYTTSPPSDMVLPKLIVSSKGNAYELEEALSVAREVLSECMKWQEQAYVQDVTLKRSIRRVRDHLYGLRPVIRK